jgi:hypothetical protein
MQRRGDYESNSLSMSRHVKVEEFGQEWRWAASVWNPCLHVCKNFNAHLTLAQLESPFAIIDQMGVWDGDCRDYFWFYEEWNLINKRFVKKFGIKLQDVLMELVHMHRVKLENKVVMDNVKVLEDLYPLMLNVSVEFFPEVANISHLLNIIPM